MNEEWLTCDGSWKACARTAEKNSRLELLLLEAIGFADLRTRPDDKDVQEAAAAIEDWRRRAKAEVS